MPNYIEADEDNSLEEIAQALLAIAEVEGLPGPETESSGPNGIRFVVSDELYASYKGAPSKKADKSSDEPDDSPSKKKGK